MPVLCCALLPLARCAGQTASLQNWTTEEGLPQNSVHALLQSREGYLWLATENGVARFDGLHFHRFSSANEQAFTSDDTCCLAETSSGTLLIGTANGVVALRGGGFRGLAGVNGTVLGMQRERDGGVLVQTAAGLWRVRDGSALGLALPNGALPAAMGSAADGSVLVVAGAELFSLGDKAIAPVGLLPPSVQQIAEDAAHHIWLATANSVEVRDDRLRVLHRWRVGSELPGSRVESLVLWSGGVLAGTNQGAVILHANPASMDPVTALATNALLSALVDREGDAWFGTDSRGLFGLRPRSIRSSTALAGESVTALSVEADGTLLAGTRDTGLHAVRPLQSTETAVPQKLASDVVLSLAISGDSTWVGSPEGLDRLQGVRVTHMTAADGLPDDFVRSLLALPDGTVWVGTRRGVAKVRTGSANVRVDLVLTSAEGLPSDTIGAMLQGSDGTVWIGTVSGLAAWNGTALRQVPAADGANLAVASLYQGADGTVWVGSGQGLYVMQGDRLVAVKVPLLSGSIAAVLADGAENLWVRTASGLLRVKQAALLACLGKSTCPVTVRQFGVADGMPGVELPTFGYPVAAQGPNGLLWFATRRGIATVDMRQAAPAVVAPGIAIEDARVDDVPVAVRPEVHVGTGRRRVVIGFAGLSLRAPSQLRYRYLLDGFDHDWSAWQAGNAAEYTNLPPGRFTLRVQAMNAEGEVSSEDAHADLRVDAPLYRRWWFYLGLLLLAAGVGYGLYWLRLRRVRRDFEAVLQERNRIAREIHDTLAQDFVAISLQLEVTSQLLQAGATAAATEQIDTTRTLVRDGIQDARESIWAIRAGGKEQMLPARLATAVDRTDRATLLITGAYRSLLPSREREVFRIAKEAIGNAAQHGQAQHILVELVYSEDAVLLRVSDDGAGFNVEAGAAKAGHYGLRGMHERAAGIGASLHVKSEPGQGTCVELRLA